MSTVRRSPSRLSLSTLKEARESSTWINQNHHQRRTDTVGTDAPRSRLLPSPRFPPRRTAPPLAGALPSAPTQGGSSVDARLDDPAVSRLSVSRRCVNPRSGCPTSTSARSYARHSYSHSYTRGLTRATLTHPGLAVAFTYPPFPGASILARAFHQLSASAAMEDIHTCPFMHLMQRTDEGDIDAPRSRRRFHLFTF